MNVNMENVRGAFELLIFGWFGVFFVLFILYLSCLALIKLFPKTKDHEPDEQGE